MTISKSCRFIDFSRRSEFSFDDVQYVVSAFPQPNQDILNNVHKLDELEEELLAYQAMFGNEIIQQVWALGEVHENE